MNLAEGQSCPQLAAGRIWEQFWKAHPEFVFQDQWSVWVTLTILKEEENNFVWAGVDLERREQLAISDDNILDHIGLSWGASDSAMPELAQGWQHWVTVKGFGSIFTVASWLVLHTCDHFSLFVQAFSDCIQSFQATQYLSEPELGTDVFTHSAVVLQTVVFTISHTN